MNGVVSGQVGSVAWKALCVDKVLEVVENIVFDLINTACVYSYMQV